MKIINAFLLVVSLLVLSIGASPMDTAPAPVLADDVRISRLESSTSPPTLHLEPNGTYNKPGFGLEFYVFRFEESEMVVYYIFDDTYLIGDDAGEQGTSYADITCNFHFLGFSDKYMLFLTEEGKTAISYEERQKEENGRVTIFHPRVPFDELSEDEQQSFIYPISYEKILNFACYGSTENAICL